MTPAAHGYPLVNGHRCVGPVRRPVDRGEGASLLHARSRGTSQCEERGVEVAPGTSVRDAMAKDVRAAYDQAASGADIKHIIPVGEAWNRAMQTGIADPNPYDGIDAGKVDLWDFDHYHASTAGYYLKALVIFGHFTGLDPRSLGGSECAAYELGLSPTQAGALQQDRKSVV